MSSSSQTIAKEPGSRPTPGEDPAEMAADRVTEAVGVVRSASAELGERLPEVVDTVRSSALGGARTVQALPDSTQRLVAAFSLGLGLGLSLAGAPRLLVAGTLIPAMVVAATILDRTPDRDRAVA